MKPAGLGKAFSVKEAAEYLGITPAQLRRQILAKRIQVWRMGRQIRIYAAWCDDFRDRGTQRPMTEPATTTTERSAPQSVCDLPGADLYIRH